MVYASQLRPGMAVRYEGQPYKVLMARYHPGQGKMGGVTHTRLKNLWTGNLWELSLRADLKLEELSVEKIVMEFLYEDSSECYFMDPQSYEQIGIPSSIIGPQARFLLPEMRLSVEFLEGKPVCVTFPDIVDIRISETTPPTHQQQDSTLKTARLENGVELLVPQFIKTGDLIRVNIENLEYVERARLSGR